MPWVRPDHIPYPNIWDRFEGKYPDINGNPIKYIIQDFTDDLTEAVVNHMTKYFLVKETLTSHDGFVEDEVSLKELQATWRTMLKQHSTMVAVVDKEGDLASRLAGVNILQVVQRSDKKEDKVAEGLCMKRVNKAFEYFYTVQTIFNTYKVDKFLNALGLSVATQYQGDNVGYHLLKARTPYCQATGVPLTVTLFSHPAAIREAEKDGFEVVKEIKIKDLSYDNRPFYPRLNPDLRLVLTLKWIPNLQ